MKKLLLLLLLFTGMVNAQIVNIPDAIFKAKLLSASPTEQLAKNFSDQWITIDANNDGEIQVSEAQAVKFLIVSHFQITDITGINSFSNLKTLTFRFCAVTALDLNAITSLNTLILFGMNELSNLQINNLTNLTELFAFSLYDLTTLDLSNLTNITRLTLQYSLLDNLNISNLTNLSELDCRGNRLTNLNITGLTGITKLNCSENLLSTLNVNGLVNLTDLNCSGNQLLNLNGIPNVSKLDCSNNKLTSFNISGLSNLSELNCSFNEIATLNVNTLSNLTNLNCGRNKIVTLNLNGLPNLIDFDCSANSELTSVTLNNLTSLQNFRGTISPSLTSLNLTGLPNLQKLDCSNGILTSLNLSNLSSLTELDCSENNLTNLNLTNLTNLQKLNCKNNVIANLDATSCPNLIELNCGGGKVENNSLIPNLQTLNVVGLSNLKSLNCSSNILSTLVLTGLNSLENLSCGYSSQNPGITTLDVNSLTNLKTLSCPNLQLTSLYISNLSNLVELNCSRNFITNLNLAGLINLEQLDYSYNNLSNLSLINLPSLKSLSCKYNQLVTLDILNLTNLETLNCSQNQLTTLNLTGLTNLKDLNFSSNQLSFSNLSGLTTNLISLACDANNLTSLDLNVFPNLQILGCAGNQLTSLDVTNLPNLTRLFFANNQISTIDLSNSLNLSLLSCQNNLLTNLDLTSNQYLSQIWFDNNQISTIDLSNNQNLQNLSYSSNPLPNLNVNNLVNLVAIQCSNTQTSILDLSNLVNLQSLECTNNLLQSLDLSTNSRLFSISCTNNQLTTLFIKNGTIENINFSNNPNLQYICADATQLYSIQTQLNELGMTTTVANSYCTFTPGGNHNTLTGITIFDYNNNGCDVSDEVNPFIRLDVNDLTTTGSTVTNINGTYNFYTNAGTYSLTPNVENPTWFNFSPPTANFTFADNNNNISTQNFCIAAVGLHKDIEVVFAPLEPARPGFDARYKIVFKNKGNQMHSGTVSLSFDDARTDLVVSNPAVDIAGTNLLTWNFTNLMPFENRSVIITLNINSPTETPTVNNGDILNFSAAITPVIGDELPNDNQFTFNQIVVGTYDPNDITCLEGDSVSPSQIGEYLHYAINFENLGTFYAENVVVRSEIDLLKYDISTLQVMNTSHPSSTRITGNIVEFVFENINLAAAAGTPPVGGHGDVLFKIKTKDNLVTNDTVLQKAGIYFDYNFPVLTNDAETIFAALNNPSFEQDNSIKIYPNPTSSIINIHSDFGINSIELYDVQGRILETLLETNTTTTLDISSKTSGIYFLKIKTEKGFKVEKIVKE